MNLDADVKYQKETGWKRQYLQIRSMLYKRLIHSIRNYILIFCQILIPTIFTIFACLVFYKSTTTSNNNYGPPPTLDLAHFNSPITPYDLRGNNPNAEKLAACYEASVSRQSRPIFINNEPDYTSMDAYLLRIARDHRDQYNSNYQIGATIAGSSGYLDIMGFFNIQAGDSMAISLSYLGNTLMQCFGNKEYQIETINHPLPDKPDNSTKKEQFGTWVDPDLIRYAFSACVSFGFSLLF